MRRILLTVAAFPFATTALWAATTKPHIDTSGVNMQPSYPASALPNREAGAVVLAVAVKADGSVEKVSPVKTSGFEDLDEAAITAVMKWRFVPATEDGKPTDGAAVVQIAFNPPDDGSKQPVKAGVQADYLSQNLTLDAASEKGTKESKPIPCSPGSFSVSMSFITVNTEPNSVSSDSYLEVKVGSADNYAVIWTSPAYYPPRYQLVGLAMENGLGADKEMNDFRFHPDFRKPTSLSFSWTDVGLITASVGGQALPVKLPTRPTSVVFQAKSATGRFTDARVICTPG